jgi:diaminohydroxyphosphoribosylaminopyrimidine deaminase/5-amino-6-(5-phosphoribosylamino)uracil reductase
MTRAPTHPLALGSTGNAHGVTQALDAEYVRRALANAKKGWGQTAPNPMVGAVVVSGNAVVADGWHHGFGRPHAEVVALHAAGELARGSTLYVTLEPCAHHGKTPPCVDAIIRAGVSRVVIAVRDPNPVARGGVEKLRDAGIDVTVGVEERAACELNAAFFNSFVSDRPWIVVKIAVTADWAMADPTNKTRWITGPEARAEVHRMRAGVDAVAVGIGTVLIDDPLLTVRDAPAPRRQPTRVVFDSRVRMPIDSALVRSASEAPLVIIASRSEAGRLKPLEERGVTILPSDDLVDGLRQLRTRGIMSMLVEGGPRLLGSFFEAKVIDRIAIFRSPLVFGEHALKAFGQAHPERKTWLESLPVVERGTFGEDTLITYAVREAPCSPA